MTTCVESRGRTFIQAPCLLSIAPAFTMSCLYSESHDRPLSTGHWSISAWLLSIVIMDITMSYGKPGLAGLAPIGLSPFVARCFTIPTSQCACDIATAGFISRSCFDSGEASVIRLYGAVTSDRMGSTRMARGRQAKTLGHCYRPPSRFAHNGPTCVRR